MKPTNEQIESIHYAADWLSRSEDIGNRKHAERLRALLAAGAIDGQEPVAIYHGNGIIDCGDAGHHNIELLKMIPAGAKLYKDPSDEIAVLREAMKGAEVIANAAGAEIAALRELLSELAALRRYDPNNGKRKDPYPARNLTLNVPAELLDRIDALCAGTPKPGEGHFLPSELTPPVRRILGMMLWETGPIAGALRAAGEQINNRAEDEQAAVLHWLLGFALEHGMSWEKPAAAALLKMTQGIKD